MVKANTWQEGNLLGIRVGQDIYIRQGKEQTKLGLVTTRGLAAWLINNANEIEEDRFERDPELEG